MDDFWPCLSSRGWWISYCLDRERPCPAWLHHLGSWIADWWNPLVCRVRGHELTPEFSPTQPQGDGVERILVTKSSCAHCDVVVQHSEPEVWLSEPDHPLGDGMVYSLRKE